jgi:opacity protein-like surface antigen
MKGTMRWTAIFAGSIALVATARPAAAEWFADFYAGAVFGESRDVEINDRGVGPATFSKVDFDTSITRGTRFGRYFDSLPYLGLAADYHEINPNIGPQSVTVQGCIAIGSCAGGQVGLGSFDITTRTLSFDALLRLPLLKSSAAPWGRIQPYVLTGLPLSITTVEPRNTRLFRNHTSDTSLSVGYKAACGLAVQVYTNLMMFVEYRYSHTGIDVDLEDGASASPTSLHTQLNTHSALIGLSIHW